MTELTMSQTVAWFGQTLTNGQTYTMRSREAKQIIKAGQAAATKLNNRRKK